MRPSVQQFFSQINANGFSGFYGSAFFSFDDLGTVDIGNPNNAAPELWRQIREGPSAEDLAYHDGEMGALGRWRVRRLRRWR